MRTSNGYVRFRRGAFTLLEVIIALSISVVLMTGVYGAMEMYWRLDMAGRAEMQRAQLVRAIFQRIEYDLRSVVFYAEDPSLVIRSGADDQKDRDSRDGENGSKTRDDSAEVGDRYSSKAGGIRGDEGSLVVHLSRPQRQMQYGSVSDRDAEVARLSDLQTVSYFLAGRGMGGLQQVVAERFFTESDDNSSRVLGLARMEGDRLRLSLADELRDLERLADRTELLATEVIDLKFEYYDTQSKKWLKEWDSGAVGGLPTAIAIHLSLGESTLLSGGATSSREELTYRYVIALPMADRVSAAGF